MIFFHSLTVCCLLLTEVLGSSDIYGDSVEQVTTANMKFAVSLYREIIKDPKVTNVVFSPVSIATALAMTKLGTKGNSSTQIGEALFIDSIESGLLNSAFGELNGLLFDKPKSNITLKAANGAFISKEASVLNEYKNALSVFGAEIEELDFSDPRGSADFINEWISDKTDGLITDMLQENALDSMTALLLANTLYFSGEWHSRFEPMHTEDREFYVSHYRIIKTPFMYQKGKFKFGYIEPLTLQVLEMPYVDQEISMVILLPDNFDIKTVEENINHENLTKWISELRYNTVDVTFPKFKIDVGTDLQIPLKNLGIKDIFQRGVADLSGISGDRSLFVDEIMHKAVLEVTEKGSKAAAATTVRVMARSIDISTRFTADHPFMWLIRHNKSGQILFLGRFSKPEGEEATRDEL